MSNKTAIITGGSRGLGRNTAIGTVLNETSVGGQTFTMGNAMLRKESYGNYPAQKFIMSCVYEGLQVPIDAGLRIEARYFTKLMMMPESRNMIRSLFLSMQDLGKGARRPKSEKPTEVKTVGVLGAGVMGGGIAYVSALAGIDVVLLDTTSEKAQAGKDHVAGILDRPKCSRASIRPPISLI